MKNISNNWVLILAIGVSGVLGYLFGVNAGNFKSDGEGFLKRKDFFIAPGKLGDLKMRDTIISQETARKYTKNYRDFIEKKVLLSKTDSVRIKDIIHPLKDSVLVEFPYYRVQRASIDSIFKQRGVVTLCVFPAINSNKEFTFVLVGENNNNDLVIGKIYDEVEVCPPPRNCKSF